VGEVQHANAWCQPALLLELAPARRTLSLLEPGRLTSVTRVDVSARSSKAVVPASVDVFDRADKADAATKHDTLTKDVAMGNLLIGRFTGMALPATPAEDVKLYFNDNEVADLWIAVTWSCA
jgi:hypothetical protein